MPSTRPRRPRKILLQLLDLLSLLAVASVLAFAAAPAAAQVDAAKLPAATQAATRFLDLAKGSEKTGDAPRESDPAVRRLLEAIFDARDVVAARSIPFQALTTLKERMLTGVNVGTVYMLAGTGAATIEQLSADPDGNLKVNLNVIKFPAEMGRFFDFQLRIQGAVVDAVTARLAEMKPEEAARPNFQSGLADIRQGSAGTVGGLIETLAINGLTEEWRRERLPALTAVGPKLAKFLEAEQKTQLKTLAIACADVMDDAQVKRSLQEFAAAVGGG